MTINLKTKLNLPKPVKTDAHLALPTNGCSGLCASFYNPDQLDIEALNYAKQLKEYSEKNTTLYVAVSG